MNKETEMYLVKRNEKLIEELTLTREKYEHLSFNSVRNEEEFEKVKAFEFLAKFFSLQYNSATNQYWIVCLDPQIETDVDMFNFLLRLGIKGMGNGE